MLTYAMFLKEIYQKIVKRGYISFLPKFKIYLDIIFHHVFASYLLKNMTFFTGLSKQGTEWLIIRLAVQFPQQ